MDGVLDQGRCPTPDAIHFLREVLRRGIPYLLPTNHGCLTPAGFSKKLATRKMPCAPLVHPDRVVDDLSMLEP
ncbi:MAG: hypothetical protein ACOYMV_08990 [Verrucomicrobiia bacterium]